jgi:hypothetical protein
MTANEIRESEIRISYTNGDQDLRYTSPKGLTIAQAMNDLLNQRISNERVYIKQVSFWMKKGNHVKEFFI